MQTLAGVAAIYIALIICEAFRYITLIYINKKGYISQVTLYGALHGFYVVIIWTIAEETFFFDHVFVGLITIAYLFLFFSKYSLSRVLKLKNNNGRIKFIRVINHLEQTAMLQSKTRISIDGKYFYGSGTKNNGMNIKL